MAEYICKEDAIKLIREDKVEITPLLTMITPYYSAEQAFDAINQACERHIAFIRDLPLEDVQPVVHGKWKLHGEPPWYIRECSKCGEKWHHWHGYEPPNYCSNCGARMDGET